MDEIGKMSLYNTFKNSKLNILLLIILYAAVFLTTTYAICEVFP